MVALPQTFNPHDIPEDDRNFDPIPRGNYKMQVIESTVQETKAGTGELLTLTLEVIEGPFKGRRIWDRLNVRNQNPDAQRIAQRSLADLCLLVGVAQLRDTEELHFKPFVSRVTIEEDKSGQYGPQNRVRYASQKSGPPEGKRAPAAQANKPAPASTANKPWVAKAQQQTDDEIPF